MFAEPKKIVEQAGVLAGQKIVDLGAGSGYFTNEIAKALMSTGTVFAVDVNKDLLLKIKNNATGLDLSNVEVIAGDVESPLGTNLAESVIDICFACNIFFQLQDKGGAVKEIKRILKPGGRLVLVDWGDVSFGVGPKKEMIFDEKTAKEFFESNGFVVEKKCTAGSHHYGIIFRKM